MNNLGEYKTMAMEQFNNALDWIRDYDTKIVTLVLVVVSLVLAYIAYKVSKKIIKFIMYGLIVAAIFMFLYRIIY